mmetsp:Transcript_37533/g.59183  ORF Transcript_37533/g.59183 Transcript_37533/m.59183 type:complete len:212 (-) Transcript_37533:146-781(-)
MERSPSMTVWDLWLSTGIGKEKSNNKFHVVSNSKVQWGSSPENEVGISSISNQKSREFFIFREESKMERGLSRLVGEIRVRSSGQQDGRTIHRLGEDSIMKRGPKIPRSLLIKIHSIHLSKAMNKPSIAHLTSSMKKRKTIFICVIWRDSIPSYTFTKSNFIFSSQTIPRSGNFPLFFPPFQHHFFFFFSSLSLFFFFPTSSVNTFSFDKT